MNALDQKRGLGNGNDNDSAALERTPQDPAQTCPEPPSPNHSIRVLVVDGRPAAGPGITACLAKLPNITTVAYATEGQDALYKARTLRPDIVVTELDEPRVNGLSAIAVLLQENPEIKALILSVHRHVEIVLRSLESGARGYVLKNAPADELVRAIEAVHGGDLFLRNKVERVALKQVGHQNDEGLQTRATSTPEPELAVAVGDGLGGSR